MDGDRPKITDFGLAKRLDKDSMTATGEVLGTPGFMAPEQASNAEGADKSTDVYGLGAILYATLTGRPPFQAANVVETSPVGTLFETMRACFRAFRLTAPVAGKRFPVFRDPNRGHRLGGTLFELWTKQLTACHVGDLGSCWSSACGTRTRAENYRMS
jgi:serine/threonine protein kinase